MKYEKHERDNMKTYTHKFSNGAICTVKVSEERPKNGSTPTREINWVGEMSPDIADEYTQFQHVINQDMADTHGIKIMCVTPCSDGTVEKWGYTPHEKPIRL